MHKYPFRFFLCSFATSRSVIPHFLNVFSQCLMLPVMTVSLAVNAVPPGPVPTLKVVFEVLMSPLLYLATCLSISSLYGTNSVILRSSFSLGSKSL